MTADGFKVLQAQIRRDEGFRSTTYRDPAGVVSVGVGHNIEAHPITLPPDYLQQLFDEDCARAIADTVGALPWVLDLDEPRQRVLYNMAFNLGIAGLLRFTVTLAAVHRRDYEAAATAMLCSRWADQVKDRATRLAAVMRTGTETGIGASPN